jgi:selenophosphate synthetase-related protein
MAGLVGTLAMLAEASGTGARIDAAAVPRPPAAALGDWMTCFPGFALLTADRPDAVVPDPAVLAPATVAPVGVLTDRVGEVAIRWPDGRDTIVISGPATGLGVA